ncbi:MAG: SMP-30/gluconolactonase/LRE family protein [Rhizobiaceae bacterium]
MQSSEVKLLDDTVCELGEGPAYDPLSDTLFWLDIAGKRLLGREIAGGVTHIHELPCMASAIAFIDEQRQLLATETGLMIRDRTSGQLELIQPIEADNPVTRSNDARVHPSGAFWIGTMGKKAERKAGSFYWYRKGELQRLFPDITVPNSICFSPDGSLGYFVDSFVGKLFRVECDPANGMPIGEPAVLVDHSHLSTGIDGSVVDNDGNIWNAHWAAGCLDVYSPDGKQIETIPLPVRQPTCPAFFGPDADRLAITSAWENMSEADRADDPEAGKTFELNRKVSGRHEPRVLL